MQHHILLAFRKRLSKRGYRNISICKARDENNNIKSDIYVVTATEPLTNTVHNQRRRTQIPTFEAGEIIAVIELYNGYAKCHIAALPTRITHQSFTLNFA